MADSLLNKRKENNDNLFLMKYNKSYAVNRGVLDMQPYEKMEKSIASYIMRSESDYALLLTGKWGCGKTYFLDKKIKKSTEKQSFIYFSLNGATSISDVLDSITLELAYSSKILNQGKDFINENQDSIENISGKGKALIEIGSSIMTFFAIRKIKALVNQGDKQYIILLDDLERISENVDITDLLGAIHTKFVLNGIKVVYIADDTEIKDSKKFAKEKEKYIRRTIAFASDKYTIFKSFLDELHIDNNDFMLILQEVFPEEQVNLRTVKFCLDCYKELEEYYETLSKEDFLSPDIYFYAICQIGKFYRKGNDDKEKIKGTLGSYFIASQLKENDKASKTEYEKFAETTGSKLSGTPSFIFDLIYDGTFLEDDVKQYLLKPKFDDDPIFKLGNIQNLETEEFTDILKEIQQRLTEKKYSVRQYGSLYNQFLPYAEKMGLGTKYELCELMKKSIFDTANKEDLQDTFAYWLKDDYSRLKKAHNQIEEELLSEFEKYSHEQEMNKADFFVHCIMNCDNQILANTIKYKDIYNSLIKYELVDKIFDQGNKSILFFATFISSAICNLSNAYEFYTDELPALEDILKLCDEKIAKTCQEDFLRIDALKRLRTIINDAIRHIKDAEFL